MTLNEVIAGLAFIGFILFITWFFTWLKVRDIRKARNLMQDKTDEIQKELKKYKWNPNEKPVYICNDCGVEFSSGVFYFDEKRCPECNDIKSILDYTMYDYQNHAEESKRLQTLIKKREERRKRTNWRDHENKKN